MIYSKRVYCLCTHCYCRQQTLKWRFKYENFYMKWSLGVIDMRLYNEFCLKICIFDPRDVLWALKKASLAQEASYVMPFKDIFNWMLGECFSFGPGHGRSVTDFWGWDAQEAQLRCPDGVWVVIEEDVVPGGALNLNSTNLPRPWSPRESSHGRAGNRTRDLMVSSQKLWSLDHEAAYVRWM